MPTSPEADTASAELKKLTGSISPLALADRRTRADLFAKGKRYSDAATEYRDLLDEVSPDERPGLQLALASALQKSGRSKDAKQVLSATPDSTPDIAAQKLYLLGEVARAANEDDEFLRLQAQLRQSAPTSGSNSRCWRQATSTCCGGTTTRQLILTGKCSSVSRTVRAPRMRIGRWRG